MRPALEVADIFRRHGEAFRRSHDGHLGRIERRIMAAIEVCRTPALGGHVEQCGDCGLVRCAYNSCRNRHCPKCQGLARAEWLEGRQAELLPVPYYHVVFTLPPLAAEIAFQNKRAVVYAAPRLRAAAEAMGPHRRRSPTPSAQRSARSPCSTLGGKPCSTTRICTALSQAVASRQTKLDGWLAGRGSSCRFASSGEGSALCSLRSPGTGVRGRRVALLRHTRDPGRAHRLRLMSRRAARGRMPSRWGRCRPHPSQTRTCRFPASGSSRERFARGSVAMDDLD